MLATVHDEGESEARVAMLREKWGQYLSSYTSGVDGREPSELATTAATPEVLAQWRWFAQYNPSAVTASKTGPELTSGLGSSSPGPPAAATAEQVRAAKSNRKCQ